MTDSFDSDCVNARIIPMKTKKIMQAITKEPIYSNESKQSIIKIFNQSTTYVIIYYIIQIMIIMFIVSLYTYDINNNKVVYLIDFSQTKIKYRLNLIAGFILFISAMELLDISLHRFLPQILSDLLLMLLGLYITTIIFIYFLNFILNQLCKFGFATSITRVIIIAVTVCFFAVDFFLGYKLLQHIDRKKKNTLKNIKKTTKSVSG